MKFSQTLLALAGIPVNTGFAVSDGVPGVRDCAGIGAALKVKVLPRFVDPDCFV
ncbi:MULTISPECIES: hypothetical protein [Pseudomonas]|uniref:hypothetical protein n=1 Tax=Pseudomonas TaxID=286 RepID=UPI0014862D19|nr:hypothetical protein [Pseudomonas mosselii]